ncbi:transketolase [Acetoanaerobium pronyense]|uniref:Transketolase n=1 Tax=Acetoanaerobium pronyense TaxID=1482736 RepID=A0ABS4KF26_9FIRM|nr:transketolase [Acetoanaerobium pronyense]
MKKIDERSINTIRFLSVDAVNKANSGHPGLPMGAAPMAYTIWSKFLRLSPSNPKWENRDRFVLSAGHGSMLLYSMLHLFNYDLSMDELKNFRQLDSKTPGHPEVGHTEGVETTTGPLGQGFANAVGMAIAEKHLGSKFNTNKHNIVDHYTYCIAGDGDMMEGITYEAASIAGTLKLDKLIVLYDDNKITIDGGTDISFSEDVKKRFESQNWNVQVIKDGNDIGQIRKAILKAQKSNGKPNLIMVKTIIGFGSPNRAGTSKAHGAPLGKEEAELTRKALGWEHEEFEIPEDVRKHFEKLTKKKDKEMKAWQDMLIDYAKENPELYKEWKNWHSLEVPTSLLEDKAIFGPDSGDIATRSAGGEILNNIAKHIPNIMGGSADLNESTKTYIKSQGDFLSDALGSNLFFGIREHAMGAIVNGITLHGGLRSFGSTFLVFSDYMRTPIRLASLMNIPSLFIFTHDSIGVGEDGPTHQPVEHVSSLRNIPGISVWRPADYKESAYAYIEAMKKTDGPSVMALTRQNLPVIKEVTAGAQRGGYILSKEDKDSPDIILMGSGSEVNLLLEAKKVLKEDKIDARVVSMPNMNIFEAQDKEYKESVLPKTVKARVSVEAGVTTDWYKYLGFEGRAIGMDTFGASAPIDKVMERFGFTVENIVKTSKEII